MYPLFINVDWIVASHFVYSYIPLVNTWNTYVCMYCKFGIEIGANLSKIKAIDL